MNPSPQFFTATMAGLYARQGYLRKAAQIYRYLLQQEPDREDFSRCLITLEEQISRQAHPSRKELGLMLREWADLLKKHNEFKRNRQAQKKEE